MVFWGNILQAIKLYFQKGCQIKLIYKNKLKFLHIQLIHQHSLIFSRDLLRETSVEVTSCKHGDWLLKGRINRSHWIINNEYYQHIQKYFLNL